MSRSEINLPVPWASTKLTCFGSVEEIDSALLYSALCDFETGTLIGEEFAPWLTAEPVMTARIESPSARARASGLRSTRPAPSPRQYPLALASKALDAPVGLKKHAAARFWDSVGLVITLTPPARANEHSPLLTAYSSPSVVSRPTVSVESRKRFLPLRRSVSPPLQTNKPCHT